MPIGIDLRRLLPDPTQTTLLDVLRARGVPSEQILAIARQAGQPGLLEALGRPQIPSTDPLIGQARVNPPISPFLGQAPQGALASLLEAAMTVPQSFPGFSPEMLRAKVSATNLIPEIQKPTPFPSVGTDVEAVSLELTAKPFQFTSQPERAMVNRVVQERALERARALTEASTGAKATQKAKEKFGPPIATLEELERQANVVFTATGPISRLLKAPETAAGVLLQADPAMVQFESLKGGTLATFVRVFGDVGALSEGDIQRAKNLMPKLLPVPDTREVALGKLKQLRDLIQEISRRSALPADQAITPVGTTKDGKPIIQLPDGRRMVVE